MKQILLLAKPLAALVALGTVTFHAARTNEAHRSAAASGTHPTPSTLVPPIMDEADPDLEWFASHAVAGRGDPSSSSGGVTTNGSHWWYRAHFYAGIGDYNTEYRPMAFPHDRSDLLWSRLRLRDLPDGNDTWRPWRRFCLHLDDLPCEEPVEQVTVAAPDRTAQVLAYQAAALTLPTRSTPAKATYGVYVRANVYSSPERHGDRVLTYGDSLEHAYHNALLQQLARTVDSLIEAHRKDTTMRTR